VESWALDAGRVHAIPVPSGAGTAIGGSDPSDGKELRAEPYHKARLGTGWTSRVGVAELEDGSFVIVNDAWEAWRYRPLAPVPGDAVREWVMQRFGALRDQE
jgi:hypothetical protein